MDPEGQELVRPEALMQDSWWASWTNSLLVRMAQALLQLETPLNCLLVAEDKC